jgi:NAD(P)-dependent dehydrogenase (short-subunit alcohol dehydrogenase family)
MRFRDKTVLVTGAGTGGMGRATALQFAREGANVVVVDIDAGAAEGTASSIRDAGGTALPACIDLRDRAQVFDMVDRAVATFGTLDVVANVAGIYPHASVAEMREDFWDDVLAVDLKGPLFTCQAALRHMVPRGGAIVNVASGAAFYAIRGLGAYSAAKAGLVALSRVIALEAAPAVRVNVVVPGSTAHPGREGAPELDTSPERALTERWLLPQEVAEVVVWCASDDATAVNGALIRVGARQML